MEGAARRRSAPQPGDLLLIVADERPVVRHVLGLLRLQLGRPPVNEGGLNFLWVVDFPLFEGIDEETGAPIPAHHPFTMPHAEDLAALGPPGDPVPAGRGRCWPPAARPTTWCSTAGSWARARCGSTAPSIQQRIFELLGIDAEPSSAVRVPARGLSLRRAAPRRLRLRHRPPRRPAGRRGEHPGGHRLPEDAVRVRIRSPTPPPSHRPPPTARPGPPASVGAAPAARVELAARGAVPTGPLTRRRTR